MSDERLDRLIDDVAKQLTAGQPSSDFRARVIARLDRPPRRAWWTSWIAVPLGAMAVALIALAVARPFMGRDRGAGPAPRQSSQAVKTETAPAAPTPDTTTVRLPPCRQAASARQESRTRTYASPNREHGSRQPAAARIRRVAPPQKSPRSRRRRWTCRRSASKRSGLMRCRPVRSPCRNSTPSHRLPSSRCQPTMRDRRADNDRRRTTGMNDERTTEGERVCPLEQYFSPRYW